MTEMFELTAKTTPGARLVRIAESRHKSIQLTVKLMVIAHRPEEAVTLRWELL